MTSAGWAQAWRDTQRELARHHAAYARGAQPLVPATLLQADLFADAWAGFAGATSAHDRAVARDAVATLGLALVEADAEVIAARAQPMTWPGYRRLCAARATASTDLGVAWLELLAVALDIVIPTTDEDLASVPAAAPLDAPDSRWLAPDITVAVTAPHIAQLWHDLAGAAAVPTIVADHGDPRCYTTPSGTTLALPLAHTTLAAWSTVLHELGHALVAHLATVPVARRLDEACAMVVAQQLAHPAVLAQLTSVPNAAMAVARGQLRQRQLAGWLADIEVHMLRGNPIELPTGRVAPALWREPGAQLAYQQAACLQAWPGDAPRGLTAIGAVVRAWL